MKYLIIICITILLWKIIDVIPQILSSNQKISYKKHKDPYFKEDENQKFDKNYKI